VTTAVPVVDLATLTTFRVGGPAAELVEASTEAELVEAVRAADAAGTPVLVLGGGSNLLVADAGFPGRVVRVATRGLTAEVSDCGGAYLRVAAGEQWDEVVARAVDEGWQGIEALSGIPGLVGATPVQNVGAYGQQVSDVIASVRAFDRAAGEHVTFASADCGFGYRTSRFKQAPGRYLVLTVDFQLSLGELSGEVRYPELARRLATDMDEPAFALGDRAPMPITRAAVLAIRRAKGMVLDDADFDTWGAGSFFTNPILDAATAAGLPADAPRYAADGDQVKTSAAWLIERSGFGRGYGTGPARVSGKHTLALTNRGTARADDVVALARQIRDGVRTTFAITLEPEPTLVGLSLD
jgi:UDP-N-acetylmuramate dehydrogenase